MNTLIPDLFHFNEVAAADGKLNAKAAINPSHPLFAGHFPGKPITPGVLQLQLVKELIERRQQREIKLKELNRCKFLAIWDPAVHPVITVELSGDITSGEPKINASGYAGETTFFKFSASYQ